MQKQPQEGIKRAKKRGQKKRAKKERKKEGKFYELSNYLKNKN